MTCKNCSSKNSDSVLFCRVCGMSMGDPESVECESHPAANATGICVVCGRPVCGDCSTTKGAAVFCKDASHALLMDTHMRFAFAENEFDADLVARNLAAHDVPAIAFSLKKYSQFYRFTDNPAVSLFVSKEMHETALRIVDELELNDFLVGVISKIGKSP